MLCAGVCDRAVNARAFVLFDIESLRGVPWADMEARYVGADTAGNIQSVFYIAYALFLLFAWNDAGKNMGNIPI